MSGLLSDMLPVNGGDVLACNSCQCRGKIFRTTGREPQAYVSFHRETGQGVFFVTGTEYDKVKDIKGIRIFRIAEA